MPVQTREDVVLLYPEWDTSSHAPTSSAVELAGLRLEIDRKDVAWTRDHRDVHAFHVASPPGARMLTVSFDYLSPHAAAKMLPQLMSVEWQRLLLYPAGWYTRNIQVQPDLLLPEGMTAYTPLSPASGKPRASHVVSYAPETLDRLIDSPVYAGRYTRQVSLGGSSDAPVRLDLLADSEQELALSTADLSQLRLLVVQASKVFGPPPFRHYDALVSLSDTFPSGGGQEHLEEGESNLPADYFTHREKQLNNRDLIAHEYVHAWNGGFRRPIGLWSPIFNQPTDPSLLWLYEGQTEFWGRVLAARSGMRTLQQTLDQTALDAASTAMRPGRHWKSLEDSTLDVLYMPGHLVAWRNWQRREDYYPEGVLLWLDVDSQIRKQSHERYGLDDFAAAFFNTHGKVRNISTYTYDDIVRGLNALVPFAWDQFLKKHLQPISTKMR